MKATREEHERHLNTAVDVFKSNPLIDNHLHAVGEIGDGKGWVNIEKLCRINVINLTPPKKKLVRYHQHLLYLDRTVSNGMWNKEIETETNVRLYKLSIIP